MNKQWVILIVTLLLFPPGTISAPAVDDKLSESQTAPTGLEPITGAFGIPLGEHFKASMVSRVLSKQEHTYSGQGGTKLKGSLLHIEPSKPDKRFQQYSLKTTDAGIIYAIQGDYQYNEKPNDIRPEGKGKGLGKPGNKKQVEGIQSTCKAAVKTIAKELESLYGKPRGQGWDGLWFTFRQISNTSNRGLKLYGHRCRTGMYSIIYTDEIVQRGAQSGKANMPLTGNKTGLKTDNQSAAKL